MALRVGESATSIHSDGVVKMYPMDSLPIAFWVRDGRSKSAEFTIPAGDDLSAATGVLMA